MTRAERWHRQDAAIWQALVDGPLAGVEMGDPVPRDPANDAAYAETMALYARAFPDGTLFGKVWPASWHDRIARWHLWPFSLTAIGFGGLLISAAPEGAPRGLGTLLLVAGGPGSGVAGWVSPWTGDYSSEG